jgi:hypothetical protein
MFHDVGHVNVAAVNSRLGEGFVQDAAGGTDKWLAREVLAISRLFADHHHSSRRSTFSKNRLCALSIQVTAAALTRGCS